MWPQYTDQVTAQVRPAEQSLAQQPAVPQLSPATRDARRRRKNTLALAMISAGLLMLLGRYGAGANSGAFTGAMVLLTIASCFLFFAFWLRIYGLLIPGAILSGLSIGVAFAFVIGGVSILYGLSLAFLALLFVGRSHFNVRSKWPAIPAVILFTVGTIVAIAQLPALLAGNLIWLPLLLVGAGVYLARNRS